MQSLCGRKLRMEPLDRRTLLASNVLDTPAEVTDFSSDHVYIRGVIESSETRDVFKVSLGSNPTIAIFSGNAYLNESIHLELMDANGNTIQQLEDGSSPAHYYFDALAKGDYFFVVTSDAVDDVEYGLTLNEYRSSVEGGTLDPETRTDDADEIGPIATELILTDGTGEMNGALEVKGDVDVFRFTVGEFDHLDLRGLRIDGGEALTVRLFFGDGRYWNFVVDENSQVLADPRELVGSHFQHLPAGEYFVVVSSNDVQAVDYRISVTAYHLTTEHTMGNVIIVDGSGENGIDVSDEVGPNASELKMTELFGDMVSAKGGTLEVEGDVDVYRFTTKSLRLIDSRRVDGQ